MNFDDYSQRILAHLADKNYRIGRTRALARDMGIADADYGDFRRAVKALADAGRIAVGGGNALVLPEATGEFTGTFRANPRGFGFVIPESPTAHGDLFIPPGNSINAITGDLVSARVMKKGKRDGKMIFEGRITRIIERGRSQFVGTLLSEGGRSFIRPEGNLLHSPIFIPDARVKGAAPGQQVVVEITRYPSETIHAQGVIAKVLGSAGEPEVDTLSMIYQHQLPHEFDEAALDYARQAVANYDPDRAAEGREDLRELTVITIDPDDARDFDDAISITSRRKSTVELGVHIADVSYFVGEDSPLDAEARHRANSVYFPRYVIPMLPEVLSNGLCSLQEGEPRLTKSAFITYNADGHVISERVANTIIASAKRLSYRQASAVIEGKPGRLQKRVVELLREMERLARAIQTRRLSQGMLELDLPEVDLVFDDAGRVTGVTPTDTSYSHKIIEMFMVEANECVARLLAGLGVPHLRRIHPDPEENTSVELTKYMRALGLRAPNLNDRAAIQSVLREAAGTPHAFAVNLAVLRSMQRAVYSPKLLGHYALASEHYAHFTSPIRRYPDLTIHRLIARFVEGTLLTEPRPSGSGLTSNSKKSPPVSSTIPTFQDLEDLGAHCSQNERRAEDAERELRLVKILRLLEPRIGEELDGIVTGVTNFGVFVQLREFLIDGLLRFEDLGDDWWEVDTSHGCVIGQRSGRRVSIGQSLGVIIDNVDLPTRRLDLAITPSGPIATKQSRSSQKRDRSRIKTPSISTSKSRGRFTQSPAKSKAKSTRKSRTPRPSKKSTRRRK